jgi:hypothetical protein
MGTCFQRLLCLPWCHRGKRRPAAPGAFTIELPEAEGRNGSVLEAHPVPITCPTCLRIMPRAGFCNMCRMGAEAWRLAPEGIRAPSMRQLKVGTKLYTTIHGEGLGVVHNFTITQIQTAVGLGQGRGQRAFAFRASGTDANQRDELCTYFVSIDLDRLLANEKQHIPVLVNETRLCVLTLLVLDECREHAPYVIGGAVGAFA